MTLKLHPWARPAGRAILAIGLVLAAAGCATPGRGRQRPNLELAPDDRRFAMALAHYAQGLLDENVLGTGDAATIAEFQQALDLDPALRRVNSKLALGHLLRKEPDQAIAVLEEACRKDPTNLQARLDLAITCQITGNLDPAIQAFRQALRLDPTHTFTYLALARIYFFREQEDLAIAVLRGGVGRADNQQLFVMASARGKELVEQGKLERAISYFVFLLEKSDVRRREVLNLIGQAYIELKRPDEAADWFRRATLEPDPLPDSFVKLGLIQLDRGRTDAAIATLREADRRIPDNTMVLFSLAIACNTAKRPAEALDAFDRIAAIAATNTPPRRLTPDFYLHHGAAAERAGRLDRAEAIFEKGIAAYPDSAEMLNYLAYMWAEKGIQLDRAREVVGRALKKQPDNGAYIDTLAWIAYKAGQPAEAIDLIRRADQLVGDDPTIKDHLGDILNALGRTDEAVAAWKDSFIRDPAGDKVLKKLTDRGLNARQLRGEAKRFQRELEKRPPPEPAPEPPPAAPAAQPEAAADTEVPPPAAAP